MQNRGTAPKLASLDASSSSLPAVASNPTKRISQMLLSLELIQAGPRHKGQDIH